jgi:hypothetical protein
MLIAKAMLLVTLSMLITYILWRATVLLVEMEDRHPDNPNRGAINLLGLLVLALVYSGLGLACWEALWG